MSSEPALPAGTDLRALADVGSSGSGSNVAAESRPSRIRGAAAGMLWEGARGGQPGMSLLPPAGAEPAVPGRGEPGARALGSTLRCVSCSLPDLPSCPVFSNMEHC